VSKVLHVLSWFGFVENGRIASCRAEEPFDFCLDGLPKSDDVALRVLEVCYITKIPHPDLVSYNSSKRLTCAQEGWRLRRVRSDFEGSAVNLLPRA